MFLVYLSEGNPRIHHRCEFLLELRSKLDLWLRRLRWIERGFWGRFGWEWHYGEIIYNSVIFWGNHTFRLTSWRGYVLWRFWRGLKRASQVVLPSLDGDWFMFSSCFQHRSPNLSCCFFGGRLEMVPNGMAPSDIAKKHFFLDSLLGLKQKAPKHQSRLSTCTTPSRESVLPTVIEPLRLTHNDFIIYTIWLLT